MAESHCITAHTVWAMIPFAKLMRCLHTLRYMEMVIICKEIYQNLSAFSSPFGTGLALFLSIVMSKALYLQHFNNPFQQLFNQGKYPDDIPANASAQQCSELFIYHKVAKQVYNTFKAVTQCLQNQFHKAIHEDCLAELDDPNIRLTNVHPSVIYQHTYKWWRRIEKTSMPPWTPPNHWLSTKKAGTMLSICCRCWQYNQYD